MNEQISALMDGELDAEDEVRLLRGLQQEEALRAAWTEFHVIGDVLRGAAPLSPDFSAKVSARLMLEPTVLAPVARRPRPALKRYALPLAASFAALGFVGLLAWQLTQVNQSGETPVQVVAAPQQAVPVKASGAIGPASQAYLLAHQEFSPSYAVEGTPAYIRTVSAQR